MLYMWLNLCLFWTLALYCRVTQVVSFFWLSNDFFDFFDFFDFLVFWCFDFLVLSITIEWPL